MSFKFMVYYLKHQLLANNRHGTHSPFVYQLADETIYNLNPYHYPQAISSIKSKLKNRLAKLIYRLAKHQQAQIIFIIEPELDKISPFLKTAYPNGEIIEINENEFEKQEITPQDIDFAYLNIKSNVYSAFIRIKNHTHENSVILLTNMYENRMKRKDWLMIKKDTDVTLTIDLFWLSLVYFKKGRAKADYKLKF